MSTTILHAEDGTILAICQPPDLKAAGSAFTSVGMIAGKGQTLVTVDLDTAQSALSLSQLHEQFRVDPGTAKLVAKPA